MGNHSLDRRRRWLGAPHHRQLAAWTLTELLAVLVTIAVLLALLLPAVQRARQTAYRVGCQTNLRGWGQAVHAYLTARGHYPPAATWRATEPEQGEHVLARHSLFTYLLPYFDQHTAATYVNLQLDWNHPENEPWTRQSLGGILICPAAPRRGIDSHAADYTVAVRIDPTDQTGLGRLLHGRRIRDRTQQGPPDWGSGAAVWKGILQVEGAAAGRRRRPPVRPRAVRDGTSKTILFLEDGGKPICYRHRRRSNCLITRFRWASPTIWMAINDVCGEEQLINCHNNSQPYSFHAGGLFLLYADGAIHWMAENVAPDVFVSSITRAGND